MNLVLKPSPVECSEWGPWLGSNVLRKLNMEKSKQKSVSSFPRRLVCAQATDAEPFGSVTGRGNLSSYHPQVLELSHKHLGVADTAESRQPPDVLYSPTL